LHRARSRVPPGLATDLGSDLPFLELVFGRAMPVCYNFAVRRRLHQRKVPAMRHSAFFLSAALACASLTAGAQHAAPAAPAQPTQPAPAAQPAAPKAVAGSAAAGQAKVFQCRGCHGVADWKTVFPEVYRVPKLGG